MEVVGEATEIYHFLICINVHNQQWAPAQVSHQSPQCYDSYVIQCLIQNFNITLMSNAAATCMISCNVNRLKLTMTKVHPDPREIAASAGLVIHYLACLRRDHVHYGQHRPVDRLRWRIIRSTQGNVAVRSGLRVKRVGKTHDWKWKRFARSLEGANEPLSRGIISLPGVSR